MRARPGHSAPNLAVLVSGLLRASAISAPVALIGTQGAWAAAVLAADIPAQPLARALEGFTFPASSATRPPAR